MLWMIALLACHPATSATPAGTATPSRDGTSDGSTDATTDAAAADPGFQWDGAWYPIAAGHVDCSTMSDEFVVVGDGMRDGAADTAYSQMGMASVYFAGKPTAGTYTTAYFDGYVSVTSPTQAAVTVFDQRSDLFSYSDGKAGEVDVTDDGAGGLTITWSGVSQYGAYAAGGTAYTSDKGLVVCP